MMSSIFIIDRFLRPLCQPKPLLQQGSLTSLTIVAKTSRTKYSRDWYSSSTGSYGAGTGGNHRGAGTTFGAAAGLGVSLSAWSLLGTSKSDTKDDESDTPAGPIYTDIDSKRSSLLVRLYQYHTCPFSSKVRAFLSYSGIPFEIVEVNPVFRSELKKLGTQYKKVPIVVIVNPEKKQLNDSTLIVSYLKSYICTDLDIGTLDQYYPEIEYLDEDGKRKSKDVINKYSIMLGHADNIKQRREEMRWRQWTDEHLVHIISPNVYRTWPEALQAFDYITQDGNFGSLAIPSRYFGAMAMFFISKRLKKKWRLKEDVRESLYDSCATWTKALGTKEFMGGVQPNLADLSVYGVLNCFEGMTAHNEMLKNTKIAPWYHRVKQEIADKETRVCLINQGSIN